MYSGCYCYDKWSHWRNEGGVVPVANSDCNLDSDSGAAFVDPTRNSLASWASLRDWREPAANIGLYYVP